MNAIKRWALVLLAPWAPLDPQAKALAKLLDRLYKKRPRLYDPMTNSFNAEWQRIMGDVGEISSRLVPVFAKVLGVPPRTAVGREWIFQTAIRQGWSFQDIEFPDEKKGKFPGGLDDWQARFEGALGALRTPAALSAQKSWLQLVLIGELISVDWSALGRSSRSRVHAPALRETLLDFYFSFAQLDFGPRTKEALIGMGHFQDLSLDPSAEDLERLGSLSSGPINPQYLIDVLRAIHEDPNLKPRVSDEPPEILESWIQEITERWYQRQREYLRLTRERDFLDNLGKLFSGGPLPTLKELGPEWSEKLKGQGLPHLTVSELVYANLAFFALAYAPTYRTVLGQAFLSVDFLDNGLKKRCIAAVDQLDQVALALEAWRGDVQVFFRTRIEATWKILENNLMDRAAKDSIKSSLEGLATTAEDWATKGQAGWLELKESVAAVLSDWGADRPRIVGNVPGLLRKFPELHQSLESLKGLLDALDSLTTIKTS